MPVMQLDRADAERQLRSYAASKNIQYDASDLEDVFRQSSYDRNAGTDPNEFLKAAFEKYDERAGNTPNQPENDSSNRSGTHDPFYNPAASQPAPPPAPAAQTATATDPDRTSREAYVKQLYQWFLERDPESDAALRSHIDGYAGSNWTNDVVQNFLNSEEYKARAPQRIRELYQQLLGREATDEDVAYWLSNRNMTAGVASIRNSILNSAEYKARAAQQPPPGTTTGAPAPVPAPTGGTPPPSGPTGQPVPTTTAAPGPSSGPFPEYRGGAFTDPATNFAEQSALARFGQRTNPAPDSGTALFESFAKEFATMLKGDVFSDSEEAALRTKAFEQVEQLRRNEIEQKKAQLSQRGISAKSGIYISEMNRIDDKYDRLRASNENELLTTAITERQRRLSQSFSVLAQLAASEEGRRDAALTLAMIPLQLQDQAFQRLVTASNMGGDLSGVTNSLMQLLTMSTNSRLYNEQQRGAALDALGQFIGQYWM